MKYIICSFLLMLGAVTVVHADTWGNFAWGSGKWGSNTAAINGACGSANGTTSTSAPSANLCSVGIASAVSGSGPWNWFCLGIDGGTAAQCSAPTAPKAKVSSKNFDNLQAAFDDPATGATVGTSTIKLLEGLQDGRFTAVGKVVVVQGGYSANYTDISTQTTIQGTVTVKSGTIRVNNLKVR